MIYDAINRIKFVLIRNAYVANSMYIKLHDILLYFSCNIPLEMLI